MKVQIIPGRYDLIVGVYIDYALAFLPWRRWEGDDTLMWHMNDNDRERKQLTSSLLPTWEQWNIQVDREHLLTKWKLAVSFAQACWRNDLLSSKSKWHESGGQKTSPTQQGNQVNCCWMPVRGKRYNSNVLWFLTHIFCSDHLEKEIRRKCIRKSLNTSSLYLAFW